MFFVKGVTFMFGQQTSTFSQMFSTWLEAKQTAVKLEQDHPDMIITLEYDPEDPTIKSLDEVFYVKSQYNH